MERAPFPLPKEFISDTQLCAYATPITECINKISKFGAVIVTKNSAYYGIVDSTTISRTGKSSITERFPVGKFAMRVPPVDSETSIDTLIRYFYESGVRAVPYAEKNKMAGIIKIERILATVLSMHMLRGSRVKEGMSSPVIAIDSSSNIAQARAVMHDHKINRLVVLDKGRLAGLLRYENMLNALSNPAERAPKIKDKFYSSSNINVGSMSDEVFYSIDQNSSIEDAIRELIENNAESLLVLNDHRPVGIVTIRDILGMAVSSGASPESTVMISGLDDYTKEYESEISDAFSSLMAKLNKFSRLQVSQMFVNVRRHKARNYEVRVRAIMQKSGMFTAGASGYTLESAVDEAAKRLYNNIKDRKEVIVAVKKRREREYGE